MKKIIFVCHGNICRSVCAEYIMKYLSKEYDVTSRATSLEEIGNDIYPPMKKVLLENHIPFDRHYASRINKEDYDNADYIFYMDNENYYSLIRMFGEHSHKIIPIYKYSNNINEIEDPWYTGRYTHVYKQIYQCIIDILNNINKEQ